MSGFSLILVLQFKTSKIINNMTKIIIKSQKITPLGGIFHVMENTDYILSSLFSTGEGLFLLCGQSFPFGIEGDFLAQGFDEDVALLLGDLVAFECVGGVFLIALHVVVGFFHQT